ncbi:M20 family metallopeptidase [Candidatus Nephthysia bennettiae]|uniref:Amidohydrolase n=1 Tax=Candidatus Nephthysia bennettiae TaxID=3127016 RepID=A0A934K9N8_9BACT|nr:amidohydrolase [Candidatus Dormibacteraeota bacterium]MBJ7612219.1 amidohydrolase [Candidatus Dormibacteraeota bacterium]
MEGNWAVEPSQDVLDEVVDNRRHFHRHPEVSFEEHETSRFIRERLATLGLEVQECPTPTGALAVLDTGRPGRTVMLRADIDALPLHEESGVEFESRHEGRMHGCGHDAHASILLGTARTLAANLERLQGSFLFCFQPAEEIVEGAREMIARGLFERWHPDVTVGLHMASWVPSGAVVTRPGLFWGGSDLFDVSIRGPGGHGGMIKRIGNVVAAQAFLLERLYGIVDGLEHEGAGCHCSVGDVRTDGAWNIVPRNVLVRGSVRTFTPELREEALQRLRDLLVETDTEFQVSSQLELVHGTIPCFNDPNVTSTVLEVGRELVGDRASVLGQPLTVSDDMAEFLTRIPGCYFMIGARPPDADPPPAHHSPGFRIDEASLATGLRMMTATAARLSAGT